MTIGKACVDPFDRYKRTPLWYSVEAKAEEAVKVFLAEGADPNAADGDYDESQKFASTFGEPFEEDFQFGGFTPLIVAAENGYEKVVELLLTGGADVDLPANSGLTAIEAALREVKKQL